MKKLIWAVSALWIIGCAKNTPLPQQPEGTWLRNLQLSKEIAKDLKDRKGFDEANNCIQMVKIERMKDGLYKSEEILRFGAEPCPAKGQLLPDQKIAFTVAYADSGAKDKSETAAYHLFKDRVDVGEISTKAEGNEELQYEISRLCSGEYYDGNCEIKIVRGKFSDLNTLRFRSAEKQRHIALRQRVEEAESKLHKYLNKSFEAVGNLGKGINDNVLGAHDALLKAENALRDRMQANSANVDESIHQGIREARQAVMKDVKEKVEGLSDQLSKTDEKLSQQIRTTGSLIVVSQWASAYANWIAIRLRIRSAENSINNNINKTANTLDGVKSFLEKELTKQISSYADKVDIELKKIEQHMNEQVKLNKAQVEINRAQATELAKLGTEVKEAGRAISGLGGTTLLMGWWLVKMQGSLWVLQHRVRSLNGVVSTRVTNLESNVQAIERDLRALLFHGVVRDVVPQARTVLQNLWQRVQIRRRMPYADEGDRPLRMPPAEERGDM